MSDSTGEVGPAWFNTIQDAMARQLRIGEFLCCKCYHYEGSLVCKKNYFITCAGCNTSDCSGYTEERRGR